jgi:FkbM family methyltransferase
MTRFLIRVNGWVERFLVAARNLGMMNAIRLLAIQRPLVTSRETSIWIRAFGRSIHYRGAADIGVIGHFYRPGYRIRDVPDAPVRFIVEAGANIGDETMRLRYFHKGARIVSLEPEPENFRLLSLNVAGDPEIFAVQKGLWPRNAWLRVFHSGDATLGFNPVLNQASRVEEVEGDPLPGDVQAISIPSILEEFSIPEIDILKLDIEGAEYYVFDESCQQWVDKVKVFIFECPDSDHPGAAFRIFEAVGKYHFNCFIQGENLVLIRRDAPWTVETNLFF